jgi:hypothetical protein
LFLVVAPSERFGNFDICSPEWKSNPVIPIAVSQLRSMQEIMMLMQVGDWIRSNIGTWRLTAVKDLSAGATLQLDEE